MGHPGIGICCRLPPGLPLLPTGPEDLLAESAADTFFQTFPRERTERMETFNFQGQKLNFLEDSGGEPKFEEEVKFNVHGD